MEIDSVPVSVPLSGRSSGVWVIKSEMESLGHVFSSRVRRVSGVKRCCTVPGPALAYGRPASVERSWAHTSLNSCWPAHRCPSSLTSEPHASDLISVCSSASISILFSLCICCVISGMSHISTRHRRVHSLWLSQDSSSLGNHPLCYNNTRPLVKTHCFIPAIVTVMINVSG